MAILRASCSVLVESPWLPTLGVYVHHTSFPDPLLHLFERCIRPAYRSNSTLALVAKDAIGCDTITYDGDEWPSVRGGGKPESLEED